MCMCLLIRADTLKKMSASYWSETRVISQKKGKSPQKKDNSSVKIYSLIVSDDCLKLLLSETS